MNDHDKLESLFILSVEKRETNEIADNATVQVEKSKSETIVLKSKWSILKETFLEFSKRTDLNAYGKIFDYENVWAKLIWFLILIGSLSLTAYVLSGNVLSYLEYGVVSEIGVVYETPTEFPAVTFCDYRPFTTATSPFSQTTLKLDPEEKVEYGKMTAANMSYNDRKKLGLNINQIFSLDWSKAPCIYNGENCSNYLHWYWSYDYGNCFQFNVGLNYTNGLIERQKSTRAGPDNALQLKIVPLINYNMDTQTLPSGMIVFVHNASMRPLKSDGVFIETGKKTFISVKRTFVSNSPFPYTDCQDLTTYSSPLYNFIINSKQYSKYRQQDCFNLCIQESIIEQCNCSYSGFDNPYYGSSNSSIQACINWSDYKCFTKQLNTFDPVECASQSCPLECESVEYDLSVSSLVEPSLDNGPWKRTFCHTFTDLCNVTIDYETFKSYMASFTVSYPTLSYTQLNTSPAMTFASLLATLGGSMGLIVSVSVFTIFELAELIVLIMHVLIFEDLNKIHS